MYFLSQPHFQRHWDTPWEDRQNGINQFNEVVRKAQTGLKNNKQVYLILYCDAETRALIEIKGRTTQRGAANVKLLGFQVVDEHVIINTEVTLFVL